MCILIAQEWSNPLIEGTNWIQRDFLIFPDFLLLTFRSTPQKKPTLQSVDRSIYHGEINYLTFRYKCMFFVEILHWNYSQRYNIIKQMASWTIFEVLYGFKGPTNPIFFKWLKKKNTMKMLNRLYSKDAEHRHFRYIKFYAWDIMVYQNICFRVIFLWVSKALVLLL